MDRVPWYMAHTVPGGSMDPMTQAKARREGEMYQVRCLECGRRPDQIMEYRRAAVQEDIPPEHYVKANEGTYNREIKKFWCTECYVILGMPEGVARRR